MTAALSVKFNIAVSQFLPYETLGPKQKICVFQVSRPYLGFCPDPKRFIANCEENIVKYTEKYGGGGGNEVKNAISI